MEANVTQFATECYGYGPTSGGGRIFTKSATTKGQRTRGPKARARRSLRAQYRRMFRKAEEAPGFKSWARKQAKKAA